MGSMWEEGNEEGIHCISGLELHGGRNAIHRFMWDDIYNKND